MCIGQPTWRGIQEPNQELDHPSKGGTSLGLCSAVIWPLVVLLIGIFDFQSLKKLNFNFSSSRCIYKLLLFFLRVCAFFFTNHWNNLGHAEGGGIHMQHKVFGQSAERGKHAKRTRGFSFFRCTYFSRTLVSLCVALETHTLFFL